MVRIPASWAGSRAALAGSGRAAWPQVRRIPVTDVSRYIVPVTVDLGNDGMAPNATFSGAGAATAQIGPSGLGQSWSLDQCYLSTSAGQLDAAQAQVFVGPLALPQYAVTGSLQGGSSQFGLGGLGVPDGWYVWALWTGGTAGALAYLRVTGAKTVLTAG
jgi:hypothetical protein